MTVAALLMGNDLQSINSNMSHQMRLFRMSATEEGEQLLHWGWATENARRENAGNKNSK